MDHDFPGFVLNLSERGTKEQGEYHHLEDVVLGGCFEEALGGEFRYDGGQGYLFRNRLRSRQGRFQLNPIARSHSIDRQQSNDQGQRGYSLEVED